MTVKDLRTFIYKNRYIFNKENWVLHYKNLQIYFGLGLKLKKYIPYQNLINLNGGNLTLNCGNRPKSIENTQNKQKQKKG